MHPGTGVARERLGHERGVAALGQRHLPDHGAERHDVVRGLQGIRVAQVDLVLTRPRLVVGELHGDPHGLQHAHRAAPEVLDHAAGDVVEVALVVHGHGLPRAGVQLRGAQQVELDLRRGVAREPHVGGLGKHPLEHAPGICGGGLTVRGLEVAEHAGRGLVLAAPRQQLERGGVRLQQHVRLEHPGQSLDRGAVEAETFLERGLHLRRGQRDGLQGAHDVREPEPHEAHVPVLDGAKNEFLLTVHGSTSDSSGLRHSGSRARCPGARTRRSQAPLYRPAPTSRSERLELGARLVVAARCGVVLAPTR